MSRSLLIVGCLTVAAILLAPSTAAAGPDLAITSIDAEGLPQPPYMVIGASGETRRFRVRVMMKNVGNAAAGPSKTRVRLEDELSGLGAPPGAGIAKTVRVPALDAKDEKPVTVTFEPYKTTLGITRVIGEANFNHQVPEAKKRNDVHKGPEIPMTARIWDAPEFSVLTKFGLAESRTFGEGLEFRFHGFDESKKEFEYGAFGTVKNHASESGTCSGDRETETGAPAWPDSELLIPWEMDKYSALVTLREDFNVVPVVCLGIGPRTEKIAFSDLETFAGFRQSPTMSPPDTELSGSIPNETGSIFIWKFVADVPK